MPSCSGVIAFVYLTGEGATDGGQPQCNLEGGWELRPPSALHFGIGPDDRFAAQQPERSSTLPCLDEHANASTAVLFNSLIF